MQDGSARRITAVTGEDALTFLQGLVTNDVLPLGRGPGIVWAGFLTPQGKYLADFFVVNTGTALLIDLPEPLADATLRRLAMYRLRAKIALVPSDLRVGRGLGTPPADALPDPRHPGMGWRRYAPDAADAPGVDFDALRVEHLVPECGTELLADDSYILEMGFDRLHGVDFRKGCYVGQEVTARMRHKTELRKGLVRVRLDGAAAPGTPIMAGDREAGRLGTRSGDRALAWLRFDRMGDDLRADGARVIPDPQQG
jgi:tRNA-modifying protein YgfZ